MAASFSSTSPSESSRRIKPFSPFDMQSTISASSSRAQSPSRFSITSEFSSMSLSASLLSTGRNVRRKPSHIELELEEERRVCSDELMTLIEPRPNNAIQLGAIDEVIFGRL